MKRHSVPEIAENVYYVGAKDWNRRIFDALIPLPQGTTYNSYLIVGKEKTALVDTVNPGFEKEMEEKISQICYLTDLDYVVMNHAEPDHAGAIPYIMGKNKEAMLIATERGAKMSQIFYDVPAERIKTVKDGDTVDLGNKTLRFVEAPLLHWPETMFTYLAENKILFPCDFFGAHTAFGIYDEDVEELIPYAKRYFGEIMMPFKTMGARALDKLKDIEIEIIAPSHGPIYKNPERIIEAYRKWTSGETREKAIAVYVSMWGSTEAMIKTMVEKLLEDGIEVIPYNLVNADVGDIAKDLVDSRAIIFGTPTVLGRMHPLAVYAAHLVRVLNPPLKYGVVLSSYGWGKGALTQASELLAPTRIEIIGTIEVNGPPKAEDHHKIAELGKQLSNKIKS